MSRVDWSNLDRRDGVILVVSALFFLFPVLSAGGYSSSIFKGLVLISLFFCWSGMQITSWERRLIIAMIAVVLAAIVSLLESQDLNDGFKQLGKTAHFLFFIPAYLLIQRKSMLPLRALLVGIVLASVVFAVIGYVQRNYTPINLADHLRDGIPRAQGGINPIQFGQLSVLFAFLQIAAFFSFSSHPKKWLLIIPIFCAFFAVYASGTRGALLFIPIASLILIWILRARVGQMFTLIILSLSLFGLAIVSITHNPISKMFAEGVSGVIEAPSDPDTHHSWGSRVEMWRNSVVIFSNHPIVGTGLGDYSEDVKALVKSGVSRSKDPIIYYNDSHSIYFQALAMTGGVGLLTLITGVFLIPGIFFHSAWNRAESPWTQFAALGGVLTVLAYALFGVTGSWTSSHGDTSGYLILLLAFLWAVGPPDADASR